MIVTNTDTVPGRKVREVLGIVQSNVEGARAVSDDLLKSLKRVFSNALSFLTREVEGVWRARHPALAFDHAVTVASRLCSANLRDMIADRGGRDLETGRLRSGLWADLAVGDIEGSPGDYRLRVRRVFVRGEEVFQIGVRP